MPRTQLDGDTILDKTITSDDLSEAVNESATKSPKIYSISDFKSNFIHIDYTICNLFPKRYAKQGEIYKVEWFRNSDLTDLILITDIEYARDVSGLALSRATKRRWVNNDGSFNSLEKNTEKIYSINHGEMIAEGKKRRNLLTQNIQIPILQALTEVLTPQNLDSTTVLMKGRQFLDDYDSIFSKFIDNASTINDENDINYGRKVAAVEIENESRVEHTEWLDLPSALLGGATIRQYLVNEFTI